MKISSLCLILIISYSLHIDIGKKHLTFNLLYRVHCTSYSASKTKDFFTLKECKISCVLVQSVLDVQAWQKHFLALWLIKKQKYGEIPTICLWQHSSAVLLTAYYVGHNALLVLWLTSKGADYIWKLCFRNASVSVWRASMNMRRFLFEISMAKMFPFLTVMSIWELHGVILEIGTTSMPLHSLFLPMHILYSELFFSFCPCGRLVLRFTPITSSYILYILVFRAGVKTSKHINGDFIFCAIHIWRTCCVGELFVCMCALPSRCNSRCFSFCKYASVLQRSATFSAGHSCMACAVSARRLRITRKIN